MPHRRELVAALTLLMLGGLYFAVLELREPFYFLWDDNASFYLPSYVHNHDTVIAQGQLPHLNYHQYLGHTYLAGGQTAVLYPPLYLGLAITRLFWDDLRPVVDVLAILHLLAAALGMYVLLRRFKVSLPVSMALALSWMTFPFLVVVARSWIFVSYTAAFLPWGLYVLDRLLERPTAARIMAVAALKALFFYQGYVQYVVLATLFEGIYVLLRWLASKTLRDRAIRQALAYGLALGASVALAAPLLFPMLQAKQVSAYRTGSLSYDEFLSNALRPGTFLSAQLLQFEPRAVHLSTGAIFSVGLPGLLALLALLSPRRRRLHLVAGAVALLALVLSTRAFGVMYFVPVLSSFRWPFKSFLIVLFFFTIAAAGAYDIWFGSKRKGLRILTCLFIVCGLAINLGVVFSRTLDAPFGPNRIGQDVAELREQAQARFPMDRGRVVSLWMSPLEPEIHRLLVFNYATLVEAFHLGGYDPLVSKENLKLALHLEYSNIFRYELTQERLDYLSSWSVRFLMVPDSRMFPQVVQLRGALSEFPQLRLSYRGEGFEVWENGGALPFAFFPGPRITPIEVEWGTNSVRLATAGRGGWLRVNIAPLSGYEWLADGREMGPVSVDDGRHVVVEVPAGVQEVEIRYVNVAFRLGTSVFLTFLLAIGAVWVFMKIRKNQGEDIALSADR